MYILHSVSGFTEVREQKLDINCTNVLCKTNYVEQSEAENFFSPKNCIF